VDRFSGDLARSGRSPRLGTTTRPQRTNAVNCDLTNPARSIGRICHALQSSSSVLPGAVGAHWVRVHPCMDEPQRVSRSLGANVQRGVRSRDGDRGGERGDGCNCANPLHLRLLSAFGRPPLRPSTRRSQSYGGRSRLSSAVATDRMSAPRHSTGPGTRPARRRRPSG